MERICIADLPIRFVVYHDLDTGCVVVKKGSKTYAKRNKLGLWRLGKYARITAFKLIKSLVERSIVANYGVTE